MLRFLFQQLDERRIREVADTVRISAEIHLKVLPIVQKCLDGMVAAAAEVNPAQVRFYVWKYSQKL